MQDFSPNKFAYLKKCVFKSLEKNMLLYSVVVRARKPMNELCHSTKAFYDALFIFYQNAGIVKFWNVCQNFRLS